MGEALRHLCDWVTYEGRGEYRPCPEAGTLRYGIGWYCERHHKGMTEDLRQYAKLRADWDAEIAAEAREYEISAAKDALVELCRELCTVLDSGSVPSFGSDTRNVIKTQLAIIDGR